MCLVRHEAYHEHCTCPNWEHRQCNVNAPCKHIPAAQLRAASDVPQAEGKLEQLKGTIGRPQRMAVDNGPEFISKALDAWAYRNRVTLEFSRPGKSTDNAYVESFNGHFREECLN
jgi:putative transposase